MPTIRELFNNKQLSERGGKTAKEAFAIRDSKNINQAVANPLITYTGLLARKGAIKGAQALPILDTRKRESLVEQTLTGANVIRLGSLPVIYGTDLPRLTLRTTPTLDRIKSAAKGEIGDTDFATSIKGVQDGVRSKLGIPNKLTPTFVVQKLEAGGTLEGVGLPDAAGNPTNEIINLEDTQNRMRDLSAIKQFEQLGVGGVLGFIGKNVNGGTPTQIGKNLIGGVLRPGKEKFREKLFGTNQESPSGFQAKGITIKNNQKLDPESKTGFTEKSINRYFGKFGYNYGSGEPTTGPQRLNEDKKGNKYTSTIIKEGDDQNDISKKQKLAFPDENENIQIRDIRLSTSPERQKKFSSKQKDRPSLLRDINKNEFIEDARGITSIGDVLNSIGSYDDNDPPTVLDKRSLEDVALVPFKIKSKITNRAVNFRTVIEGDITENITPGFGENRFVGSPFNFYTYESIERGVNFNFLIYALNAKEHKVNWEKLSFLTSLVYPQGYDEETTAVIPPIVEFTLGDLYKDKVAIINDIGYVYKNDGGWQINPNPNPKDSSFQERIAEIQPSENSPSYKVPKNDTEPMGGFVLPRLIDVSISFKFIESRINTQRKKLYSFGPQN